MLVGEVVLEVGEQLGELLGEVVWRHLAAVALERVHRLAIGARGAPDSEIDAVAVQPAEDAERLGDLERAVVRQHHAAAADAHALGDRGDLGDQDLGRGAGEHRHPVVLGDPVARVPERVGQPREVDAVLERGRARAAFGDRRLVEHAEAQGRRQRSAAVCGRARRYCDGQSSLSTPSSSGRAQRPRRVAQRLAAEQHDVGLARLEDVLGLLRLGDQPDRPRRDAGALPDRRGERHLVAGAERDLLRRRVAAGGAVDEIDAERAEQRRERDGVVERPAALDPVAGRDAHRQRELGRPGRAHRLDDLEQEPRAPGEVAAVGVGAQVRERREEGVEEVAVRGVDLEQPEAGRVRAPRGRREGLDDVPDLARRELARHVPAVVEGHGARADRLPPALAGVEPPAAAPRRVHRRLAAGVRDLDSRHGAVLAHERGDAPERRDLVIRPDARVVRADAALRRDAAGLDDHGTRAAGRARAEVHEMPVGGHALDRGVLAHRRDPDAVAELDVPEG